MRYVVDVCGARVVCGVCLRVCVSIGDTEAQDGKRGDLAIWHWIQDAWGQAMCVPVQRPLGMTPGVTEAKPLC